MRTALSLVAAMGFLIGCGPKQTADEQRTEREPFELIVKPGNRMMTLSWKARREKMISGFHVYDSLFF